MQEKRYGMADNFFYVLKAVAKSNKKLLAISVIAGVLFCIWEFVEMYFLKYVIAAIEGEKGTSYMIMTVVVISLILMLLNFYGNYFWNVGEHEYVKVDTYLEKQRMNKVFTTDYKNMESPLFLDFLQRAKASLYYGMGFNGVLDQVKNIICEGAITIIAAVMIGAKSIFVVLSITVLSVGMAKILSYVTRIDKERFSDVMAPTYRKIGYLDGTARNFAFAKDIRLFDMARVFKAQYNIVNEYFIKMNKKHHNRWILGNMGMQFLLLAQTSIMYGWLVYFVLNKGMKISEFVLYISLVTSYYKAIGYILWIYSNVKGNCLMVNDYRNFINWSEDSENYSGSIGTKKDIKAERYTFEFEHVSFKYPGTDIYVLKDINIKIEGGSRLAIVGVNGAGKTTFTKLIMRLYEPTEGRILLNGADIKEYDREEYFRLFAPVFQNIECFALPIYKNISFKDEEHTDMKKVEEVLKTSGLWDKVSSYENGVKTNMLKIFDTEGIDLSGGERQRLAMARALYKNGNIIILDEPTAALDALAEDRMYREFDNMVSDKTALFISHRLGSTRFCDNIAMFEDGQIVEEGTHEELMELNGKYAYMFGIQAQYYEEGKEDE
jgi:ABC-type multidrug transport system fused ATPase/permease subunit